MERTGEHTSYLKNKNSPGMTGLSTQVMDRVQAYPIVIVVGIVIITALLLIPLKGFDTETSMNDYIPDSKAVDTEEIIEREFTGEKRVIIVAEAGDKEGGGNILSNISLMQMLSLENSLRMDDGISPHVDERNGVSSIADIVQLLLMTQFNTTILDASPVEFQTAITMALNDPDITSMVSEVSVLAGEKAGEEVAGNENESFAEMTLIVVRVDYEAIRNDTGIFDSIVASIKDITGTVDNDDLKLSVAGGMDEEMEAASKETLTKLFPISVLFMIVILYISFRRISDVVLSITAIPIIFIWTFGLSEVIGLGFSQFSFAIPLLVISLGIDYGIHSLHRYHEEQRNGAENHEAFRLSVTHVGAALFLTTITTVGAFSSNAVSEVPGIRDFGISAAIGIASAFIIMAIYIPALRLFIDDTYAKYGALKARSAKGPQEKSMTIDAHGSHIKSQVDKAKVETTSIDLTQADEDQVETTRINMARVEKVPDGLEKATKRPFTVILADATMKRYPLVLVAVILLTTLSIFGGLQLETELNLEDVAKEDSEIVHAFNMIETNFPAMGRELGYIYIEGEIDTISTITAIRDVLGNLQGDSHVVQVDGNVRSESILPYLSALMANETLRNDLAIEDTDNNSIPDTDTGIRKAYDHLYENGITMEGEYAHPDRIHSVLHRDVDGEYDMALIIVEVKDVSGIDGEYLLEELDDDAKPLTDAGLDFVVTGEPVTRYEMITAITDGMLKSLIISIAISSIFLILVFHSVKDGFITILPVSLISTWIFGTMYFMGFTLNVLTVTIAAMSIGVGVDYSIHIRQRYREELEKNASGQEAMDMAIRHSGEALLGAAGTTIIGFGILYFAEVHMFSTYGMLSALMIFYAFIGAIVVLPGLLLLGDRKMGIPTSSLPDNSFIEKRMDEKTVVETSDGNADKKKHPSGAI